MAWNDVSESAVVKCFTKAGMLDAEGNANAVKCSNSEVDPFAELQDKFAAVDQLVGFPAPIPFRSAYFCHAFLVNKYPRNSSDDKSLIRRFVV